MTALMLGKTSRAPEAQRIVTESSKLRYNHAQTFRMLY